eukprot:Protomagalhaensia_wolfi_Nauph_80__6090@NODE_862_length_1933_cov_1145_191658_g649_i0_p3_GENE_NODE_862_length_1933_cov_1145_191658_g649_i0NODE_862_length_1933_cov_1145_191658_g649_i0_p3_ORF_typecomplete_len134_score10_41CEBP_ZZ/PF16366_5/2_4e02CEBP_ZZ/PF16366_5/0_13_NODE_862_length_1933_cov_1145_191658_g649_i010961497
MNKDSMSSVVVDNISSLCLHNHAPCVSDNIPCDDIVARICLGHSAFQGVLWQVSLKWNQMLPGTRERWNTVPPGSSCIRFLCVSCWDTLNRDLWVGIHADPIATHNGTGGIWKGLQFPPEVESSSLFPAMDVT